MPQSPRHGKGDGQQRSQDMASSAPPTGLHTRLAPAHKRFRDSALLDGVAQDHTRTASTQPLLPRVQCLDESDSPPPSPPPALRSRAPPEPPGSQRYSSPPLTNDHKQEQQQRGAGMLPPQPHDALCQATPSECHSLLECTRRLALPAPPPTSPRDPEPSTPLIPELHQIQHLGIPFHTLASVAVGVVGPDRGVRLCRGVATARGVWICWVWIRRLPVWAESGFTAACSYTTAFSHSAGENGNGRGGRERIRRGKGGSGGRARGGQLTRDDDRVRLLQERDASSRYAIPARFQGSGSGRRAQSIGSKVSVMVT